MSERPRIDVAVIMGRESHPNRWEDWRFSLLDVVVDDGALGPAPRVLRDDGRLQHRLFPGFTLELFPDEAEGYHLNLSSGAPVWFVMWRTDEDDPSTARPHAVSVSYNEAGRWLDAQERVDNVPLPGSVRAWLQAFADLHYRPEPKKRKRPASFLPPGQRG